jgi:hypothetical protein
MKSKNGYKDIGYDSEMRILSTRKDLQVETSNISPDRSQILKNMTSEMTLDSNLSELDYKKHGIDVRKSLQF